MNTFNIADNVFLNTTFVQKFNLSFNQFFVSNPNGDIVLIETGFRENFKEFSENIEKLGFDLKRIVGVIVPHFEVDEMGAIPSILEISPSVRVYAHPICAHGIGDIFNAKVIPVKDGETKNIAGIDFEFIHTKHVHQWDSLVVKMLSTEVLFSSDIFIQKGVCHSIRNDSDLIDEIAREVFDGEYLPSLEWYKKAVNSIIKRKPKLIAPMHGSPFHVTGNVLFEALLKDPRMPA